MRRLMRPAVVVSADALFIATAPVTPTGTKNAKSTGTRVDLDALLVLA